MRKVAVGDIMTRNFVSAKPTSSVFECAKELVKKRVNSVILADGPRLKGIITSTDILWAIIKKPHINLKKIKAIEIATKKVAVIKPSADILQALAKMKTYNFRRLPVLSKGELIGVITLKDILKIDPTLYTETGELAQIREEEIKIKNANINWPLEGLCDNCGAFSELLKVEGTLLCEDCRDELY